MRRTLPVLLSFLLAGCYTLQEGGAYLGLLFRAKSLSWLRRQRDTPPELISFFDRVERIKHFARTQLGLQVTKNYTSYVQLDRDYLNQVLSASPELALSDYLWPYPLVGRLPYRGYFHPQRLAREQQRLADQGYDTFVRKVGAFSTLGYLSDPLFSYMVDYDDYQLSSLIIHESVHATLFLAKATSFNESLASFIGHRGAELYLEQLYGKDASQHQLIAQRQQDARTFRQLLSELRQQLSLLYQHPLIDRAVKIEQKQAIIAQFRQQFSAKQGTIFKGEAYQNLQLPPINNAYLNLYALYYQDQYQHVWPQLLQRNGNSLKDMMTALKMLQKRYSSRLIDHLTAAYPPQPTTAYP